MIHGPNIRQVGQAFCDGHHKNDDLLNAPGNVFRGSLWLSVWPRIGRDVGLTSGPPWVRSARLRPLGWFVLIAHRYWREPRMSHYVYQASLVFAIIVAAAMPISA